VTTPRFAAPFELVTLQHDSEVLHGNPLGDPCRREVLVLVPPDYFAERNSGQQYPVVYLLAGFGSRGRGLLGDAVLGEQLPALLGRLLHERTMPRAIVVLPDCSTRYGGSQYLDSPACGPYQRYLVDEVVSLVEREFPVLPGPAWRAVMGKSSGGYGALLAAIQRPGVFGAVLAHSPDAGFEHCYLSLLPAVLDTIESRGGLIPFADWQSWRNQPRDGPFMVAMSIVAMGMCYAEAPAQDTAAVFPCDPDSGVFRDEVWRRWLELDPVRLVAAHAAALRDLDVLFLDVGQRDEYGMRWGTRALHNELRRAGVPHVFQEHQAGHHGVEYRFERSLALLRQRWVTRELAQEMARPCAG
jgi:enterochelin esterase-like enzyme